MATTVKVESSVWQGCEFDRKNKSYLSHPIVATSQDDDLKVGSNFR